MGSGSAPVGDTVSGDTLPRPQPRAECEDPSYSVETVFEGFSS